MSGVVRLALVSHAMTAAVRAGRFPLDEPVETPASGYAQPPGDRAPERARCGPELRTRGTAELLGRDVTVDHALRDLDCGRWAGLGMEDVSPDQLMAWLTDPAAAPHGGESIAALIERVRDWMATAAGEPGRIEAVTHPAVIRAAVLVALDAPAQSFWRIDVPPMSRAVLHRRGPGWTLRCPAVPLGA